MKFIYSKHQEKGVVSILSVIFFIILMSIISVSFLRIVTNEQTQVLQDDLSKGALAAARSGVEDAKRALLLCRSKSGIAQSQCYTDLHQQTCPGIFASNTMKTDLGLNANADGSIRVGDLNSDNNERYTCVTLAQDTPDYTGMMSEGLGDFIPLRGTGTFNAVRLSWHLYNKVSSTGIDGDAEIPASAAISSGTNPRVSEWKTVGGVPYIAMPRVQFMRFDSTASLTGQQDYTVGAFLVPSASGGSTVAISPSIAKGNMSSRPTINCSGAQAGYLCTAIITIPPIPAGSEYYMFIKSFYATAHYKLELLLNSDVVNFSDVQPQVDSTGAAGNVFKRILSRVSYQYDASTFYTSNSIESGMSICKNFSVSIEAYSNFCSTSGLPASETGPTGSAILP